MVCFFRFLSRFTHRLERVWQEKTATWGLFFCCAQGTGGQRLFLRRQAGLSRPFPSQYGKYETISAQGIAGCGALPGFLLLLPAAPLANRRQPQPGGRGGRRGPERGLWRARGRENSPDSVCQGCPIQRAVAPGLRRGLCLSLPLPILRRRNPACRTRSYPTLQSKGRSGRPPG